MAEGTRHAVNAAATIESKGGRAGRLIVTIDGPAGTGKSSVARALARRLGVEFLDTGAMYRGAAALAIDAGLPLATALARGPVLPGDLDARLCGLIDGATMRFDWTCDPPELIAQGRSIMGRLRDADVTALVSPLAGVPALRARMVAAQRAIAAAHPRLVTEGRDQGSVVFPDADVKIYLDAAPDVRARRRAEQLRAAGEAADESRLLAEIVARDESDRRRAVGPLVCPTDAVVVDTSGLSFDAVVDRLHEVVRAGVASRQRDGRSGA